MSTPADVDLSNGLTRPMIEPLTGHCTRVPVLIVDANCSPCVRAFCHPTLDWKSVYDVVNRS